MLTTALFSFALGVVILLLSSHTFLQIIQSLAAKWKFSPLLISLVVVGLGTSLPELMVTISAISQNDIGLTLGNLVGSSVVNISLIFGLSILAGTVKIGNNKTQKNSLIMIFTTTLFVVLRFSALSNFIQAILLLSGLILALSYDYILAVNGRHHEDRTLLSKITKEEEKHRHYPPIVVIILLIASTIGLMTGGSIIVSAAESLAYAWQISTSVVGLTILSVATTMPELITILIAEREKEDKVVVGTLIGSNIFNLTLFPTIILFGSKLKYTLPLIELLYLLLATFVFVWVIFHFRHHNIPHKVGLGLVLLFLIFTFLTIG